MYQNLYQNYIKDMNTLHNHIKLLRQTPVPLEEKENVKYRISILYKMYLDMNHTAKYLKIKCEVMNNEK